MSEDLDLFPREHGPECDRLGPVVVHLFAVRDKESSQAGLCLGCRRVLMLGQRREGPVTCRACATAPLPRYSNKESLYDIEVYMPYDTEVYVPERTSRLGEKLFGWGRF